MDRKIGRCANCGKNRVLYSRLGLQMKDKFYSMDSREPCCQKCFEKEIKKRIKEGDLLC